MRLRTPYIIFSLAILAILIDGILLIAPLKERAKVESLWTEAVHLSQCGQFTESNVLFQNLLDHYKLFPKMREQIPHQMMRNAFRAGDYAAANLYGSLMESFDESDISIWYPSQVLAKQLPQAMSRPDHDVFIPYEIDTTGRRFNKEPLIRVTAIIGKEPAPFILNNECPDFWVVSESFAEKHGIRAVGLDRNVQTAGGKSTSWIGIADTVALGELVFKNLLFEVVPDNAFENPFVVNAFLGASFFRLVGEMHVLNDERRILFPKQMTKPS